MFVGKNVFGGTSFLPLVFPSEYQQWGLGQNCFFGFQEILHTFKNSFLVEIFEHRRELCGFFFQPILTQFQGIDVVDPGLEIIVCPHFYKLPRWWLSQNWRKVGFWFKNRRNEDWKKVKVWTQYAPHLKHIFLQGFEKGPFYISNPTHCENREVVGGISPPWLKSFKNGGEFTPGGDITPLSFLSNLRRGDITTFLESYAKWGGFHTWGGYHPLVPIWPQSTGALGSRVNWNEDLGHEDRDKGFHRVGESKHLPNKI